MMRSIFRFGKITLAVCISGIFISQSTWAAQQAQNSSVYTDETTGMTIFVTDIKLKGRRYLPDYSGTQSPVTQLSFIEITPAGLSEEELSDQELIMEIYSEKAEERDFDYRVAGILRDKNATKAVVSFSSSRNPEQQTVEIDLTAAQKNVATQEDFDKWLSSRFSAWQWIAGPDAPNTMLDIWELNSPYGGKIKRIPSYSYREWDRNDRDEEITLGSLEMFGGQIAIRETLQTQLLSSSHRSTDEEIDSLLIPINEIDGVEVMAHPYEEMLVNLKAKAPLPEISSLANYVPVDRLMILVREPKAIAHFFDENNDLPNRLSPALGGSFVDNEILRRYTARFGLTPEQLKKWFSGKNVAEIALFAPDVFFLDNTDITAIIRLKDNPNIPFKAAQAIPSGVVLPVKLPGGDRFYITNHDDLLIFSSHKDELKKVLDIAAQQGAGSLGLSEEFQVMNYKLPMNAQSHVYVYFSDPFIRRLTGPEVKIGQLRRSTARAEMQIITAAALLYRLDHGVDAPDLETLAKQKYIILEMFPEGEYTLEKGARVVSKTWGTLDRLTTLTANPAIIVTEDEAMNYETYRDNYSRFWSAFFDPIAVRADLLDNGNIALETFILPLIDNSFYMELQDMLGNQPPQKTLVPIYSQDAVSTLTINIPRISEEDVENVMYASSDLLRYTSLSQLLPLIGNTAVISIYDADPIIQTAFPGLATFEGGRGRNAFGFRGEEMLMIPIFSALFSRPIDIAIPVSNEEEARKIVRNFYYFDRYNEFFILERSYNDAEEKLYLDMNIAGIMRMEFSVSVENGWLHISNHPWTSATIEGTQELAPNHASVIAKPSMMQKGLPQIMSLVQKAYRNSAYTSASELYPWMLAYDVDAQAALAIQKKALGRGTPLPAEVTFELNNPLNVKPYGYQSSQKTNTFSIKDHENLDYLSQDFMIWFRFEEDGLRTRVEFSTSK